MLANVRQTLTKRYQLAKAARIEANRRLRLIDEIINLREFIYSKVNYKPMRGMKDQQEVLFERIAYKEPELVNSDLWQMLRDVYQSFDISRQIAAAYKI